MSTRINLWRALFGEKPRILLENSDFTVTSFRYDSGVEGLNVTNGAIVIHTQRLKSDPGGNLLS